MNVKATLKHILGAALTLCLLPFPSGAVCSAAEPDKVIALTFDDGPNTTTTNEVLDLLEEYNAKGTFFLIGTNINDETAVSVKRAYDMGCEIGNHSKSHSNMGGMAEADLLEEISYVDELVYEITGEYPKFFRPPFIDVSQTMYDVIDKTFICGFDCRDFMADVTAQQRADAILSSAKDGMIYLLHDAAGNSQTVEALEIVIPELQAQGYELVTLTELFERQGETPKRNMLYSEVAKYPCADYTLHRNVFTGELSGESSSPVWSENTALDGAELAALGDDYAIEVTYEGSWYPMIALQQWSGASLWASVTPFYYNGERACFLASDLQAVLDANGVTLTDLDRITLTPYNGTMTMTSLDILVTSGSSEERLRGDVNLDGKLSVADIILLQKYLLAMETFSAEQAAAADLNEDAAVNAFDLAALKRLLFQA